MPRIAKLEHRGKVKYSPPEEAQKTAALLQNRLALSYRGLDVYKCSFCGYYHVGHNISAPVYDNFIEIEQYTPAKRKNKKRQISTPDTRKYRRMKKQDLLRQVDFELELMIGDDYGY